MATATDLVTPDQETSLADTQVTYYGRRYCVNTRSFNVGSENRGSVYSSTTYLTRQLNSLCLRALCKMGEVILVPTSSFLGGR